MLWLMQRNTILLECRVKKIQLLGKIKLLGRIDGGILITCITINIIEYTLQKASNHIIYNTQMHKALMLTYSHLLQIDS